MPTSFTWDMALSILENIFAKSSIFLAGIFSSFSNSSNFIKDAGVAEYIKYLLFIS